MTTEEGHVDKLQVASDLFASYRQDQAAGILDMRLRWGEVDDEVLIIFGGPKECYAHKNRAEYWAEGVQCWYNTNRTMDHDHNHIHTRAQLKAYDPHLAKMCDDVLGDAPWRFASPRERAGNGHLADFDPAKSPKAIDPPHIKTAALDYYDRYWKEYWQLLREKHSVAASSQ